jgi:hypothetical protein
MTLFRILIVWCVVSVASAASAEAPATFAVVVGNNHSLNGRRPDLHYADDDAAKYFEILQTIAPDQVRLLSALDADTSRLFPQVLEHALAPTKSALLDVGRELAAAVSDANQRGQQTELYFVFAGHGDVDEGMGFIELADARWSARDLEAWLRDIPFTRAHVILDSCNSFFMLGTRKPGGRYYATSEDAVRALSGRMPNVGVFLSTSADGDAFEWSEIQSGVFSHLVRSGLVGAADANADGQVDYLELAAFVATATHDVVNPNMRPHVFARGPGGHDEVPIVTSKRTGTRRLQLLEPEAVRLRLRDPNAIPLLDANMEAHNAYVLQLPARWANAALIEREARPQAGAEPESLSLPQQPEHLTFAALEHVAARGNRARGPADIFDKLFKTPFGLRALAQYQRELKTSTPPVYGVSREDAERMGLLLDQIAAAEHERRIASAIGSLGITAFYALYGGSMLAFNQRLSYIQETGANVVAGLSLGLGALSLGTGIYRFFSLRGGEQLALDYRSALAAESGDYARAFAIANESLRKVAAAETRQRWIEGIGGSLLFVGAGLALTGHELDQHTPDARVNARAVAGAAMLLGVATLFRAILIESPVQRLLKVWENDSRGLQLQPVVAPVAGGAYLGIEGRY